MPAPRRRPLQRSGPWTPERAWKRRLRIEARAAERRRRANGSIFKRWFGVTALRRATAAAALRGLGLYGRARQEAETFGVTAVEVLRPGLPHALDGFRVLHLSDLHLDGRPGYGERLRSVVAAIEADLCVLTGDYALKYRPKPEGLAEELGAIVSAIRAPRGVFGVLGNHDDSSLLDLLRDRGVDMLVNEHRRVSVGDAALWVVGVDDPCSYHTDDLASALAGVPREEFTVLLAHSPDLVDEAAEAGVDLYLCGHTHGGQIVLPGVGALYPRGPVRRYMRGLWHRGDMAGYTNRGLGCVYLEARWGAPPEAAVLTLRREEKEDER